MNKAIHFKTSMFDVSQEKLNPINPIYGLSLLLWLRTELNHTLSITEPEAEDWGWYSALEWEGSNYLVGASAFFEEGDDPTAELEWVFQVDKYRSFKDKIFGNNKMTESDSCFMYFKDLFEAHPKISEVVVA